MAYNLRTDSRRDTSTTSMEHDSLKKIIKEIVQEETDRLHTVIEQLRTELSILKESNIQLINLLTSTEYSSSRNSNVSNKIHHCELHQKLETTAVKIANTSQTKTQPKKNDSKVTSIAQTKTQTKTQLKKSDVKNIDNISASKSTLDSGTINSSANISGDFVEVKHRKRRPSNFITGTAAISEGANHVILEGEPKRAWLYVGRIKNKDTTEEDVVNYLGKDIAKNNIICKKLSTDTANFSSFQIGIPFEELTKINKPEYWPTNIRVGRFHFFRKSNKGTPSDNRTITTTF